LNGYWKIKSFAKINLALNIVGKSFLIHKIESIISFLSLSDEILIKEIDKKKHIIKFTGKFSKNIGKINTISKLLKILDKKKLLKDKKYEIKIEKNIPSKAGLGGGSMNAATILKFLIKKQNIKISQKKILKITNFIGSDVILGMSSKNLILKSNGAIYKISAIKNKNVLVIKPNFGCSTKQIYSKVKKFNSSKFNNPKKELFSYFELKKMSNDLESIAFKIYPKLKLLKVFLEKLPNVKLVRMTGSGSAMIAYFSSSKLCKQAEKKVKKHFRKYWCKTAITI
jgi:4-diphosphocytidyl-2-C-methyl-D-erythritol kinase|tara:strand:+ start:2294 stop:3142 length:849 start_codon:yes stop_codon:yes gene_type:complete